MRAETRKLCVEKEKFRAAATAFTDYLVDQISGE